MNNCISCHYGKQVCMFVPCGLCKNSSRWQPYTNADRIRQMTDDELTEFLLRKVIMDRDALRTWLKREADND